MVLDLPPLDTWDRYECKFTFGVPPGTELPGSEGFLVWLVNNPSIAHPFEVRPIKRAPV